MKGAHRIIVESSKIKYDFVIKRNITILTGNSGSDFLHIYLSRKPRIIKYGCIPRNGWENHIYRQK